MFNPILEQFLSIARDAWVFMVALLGVIAGLGLLYKALTGGVETAFGGSRGVATVILGGLGLIVLVMVAYLAIPQIVQVIKGLQPAPPF